MAFDCEAIPDRGRHVVLPALAVLVASLSATPYARSAIVQPGGEIGTIVANPVSDVLYAGTDLPEIVTVGFSTAQVEDRMPVGSPPIELIADPNGQLLYGSFGNTCRIAVVEPAAGTYEFIPVSSTQNSSCALALGQDKTLFVFFEDGISAINTVTREETAFVPFEVPRLGSEMIAAVSRDGRSLYTLDVNSAPAELRKYDLSTGFPELIGMNCRHGSIAGLGRGIWTHPTDDRPYVALKDAETIQIMDGTNLLHARQVIQTGRDVQALVGSSDGSTLFATRSDDTLLRMDLDQNLVTEITALTDQPISRGIALSPDQAHIAIVIGQNVFTPDRIELLDVTSPSATHGGIRLAAVDDQSLQRLAWASIELDNPDSVEGYVDRPAGLVGRSPLPPGRYSIEVASPQHDSQFLDVDVSAGAWTDEGEVLLSRINSEILWQGRCADPGVPAGERRTVYLEGMAFQPDWSVDTDSASLQIHGSRWIDWGRIEVDLQLDRCEQPGIRDGILLMIRPGYPRPRDGGNLWVLPPVAPDTFPPAPVQGLRLSRTASDISFQWQVVGTDADGCQEQIAHYELTRSTAPNLSDELLLEEVPAINTTVPGEVEQGSALNYYVVRAVDQAGNLGL